MSASAGPSIHRRRDDGGEERNPHSKASETPQRQGSDAVPAESSQTDSSSSASPSRTPIAKKRRLELNGLRFDNPGAAFFQSIDVSGSRSARRIASTSSRSTPMTARSTSSSVVGSRPSSRESVRTGSAISSTADSVPLSATQWAITESDQRDSSRPSTEDRIGSLVWHTPQKRATTGTKASQSSPGTPLATSPLRHSSDVERSHPRKRLQQDCRILIEQSPYTPSHEPSGQTSSAPVLVQARESLDGVQNEHDEMVRELFHLTKFVTYIGFDPSEAKEDRSEVFEHFKAQEGLDLESQLASASSSRATRRKMTQRMSSLVVRKKDLPSDAALSKSELDRREKGGADLHQSLLQKQISRPNVTMSKRGPGRPPKTPWLLAPVALASKQGDSDADRPSGSRLRGQLNRGDESDLDLEAETTALLDLWQRRQSRRSPLKAQPVPIMHPKQAPAAPQYGANISTMMSSFSYLGMGDEEVTPWQARQLEKRTMKSALAIDALRLQGKMLSESGSSSAMRPPRDATSLRAPQHQDYILEHIPIHSSRLKGASRIRKSHARKVARMIQSYWSSRIGEDEKERRAQEKHMRSLAKWTVKEVNKQWKLAVTVIRHQVAKRERLARERAGREQLSLILEQSTRYLGERQEDLQRITADSSDDNDVADSATSLSSEETSALEDSEEDLGSVVSVSEEAGSLDSTSQEEASSDAQSGLSRLLAPGPDVGDSVSFARQRIDNDDLALDSGISESDRESRAKAILDRGAVSHLDVSALSLPKHNLTNGMSPAYVGLDSDLVDDMSSEASSRYSGTDTAVDDDDRYDREMLDEQDSEEDDSEDEGLLADADLSLDELMKRYNYGAKPTEIPPQMTKFSLDKAEAELGNADELFDAATASGMTNESSHLDTGALLPPGQSPRLINDGPLEPPSPEGSSHTSEYAVSPDAESKAHALLQPFLLRGSLRPYQKTGFEWLASLYRNKANGILADEMGLGKTIQTISLLAHLACDKGVWGPHLVIAPTSVMLNWEVEFKKFLPAFKILSYFGTQKERKEKRIGWNTEHSFNVCITSYQIVLADQHIFRRKPWIYMILDEAHHIKNFRSQRWQTLLGFNSERRLLLTGTPLQNNLMDLWSLMYFLMPNGLDGVAGAGAFTNMKDFQDWFSNPLDKIVESGKSLDEETKQMVAKLHTILRPFLLRRLKSEVEKELPRKYEHVIRCRLSKRQRFLYNDFMSRAKTRESLASGSYLSIINCLMQLRKVCNHPDLFEVRPISTAFAMDRSVVADYEIKDLLVRRRLLQEESSDTQPNGILRSAVSFNVTGHEHLTPMATRMSRRLDASLLLPHANTAATSKPPWDLWTLEGHRRTLEQRRLADEFTRWKHRGHVNQLRTSQHPVYGSTLIKQIRSMTNRLESTNATSDSEHSARVGRSRGQCDAVQDLLFSTKGREDMMASVIDRFAFVPAKAISRDISRFALGGLDPALWLPRSIADPKASESVLHRSATKLQIAFPDASLLQYDCGKLQELARLMRRLKDGQHRILIFTQMTRVLDILESFLNLHGYRYLRLDGATRIDRRQALTEKFNRDPKIDAFILSTRSGGLGINLTGADTVLFYDLDWNSAIEAQCMDRAHRIGQTRDVHIYRFVSEATIEENMLRKADQKRLLDSIVVQDGTFTTEHLKRGDWRDMLDDGGKTLAGVQVGIEDDQADPSQTTHLAANGFLAGTSRPEATIEEEAALLAVEDEEDQAAAKVAREEMAMTSEEHSGDFTGPSFSAAGMGSTSDGVIGEGHEKMNNVDGASASGTAPEAVATKLGQENGGLREAQEEDEEEEEEEEEDQGTIDDYMLRFVEADWSFFGAGHGGGGFKV